MDLSSRLRAIVRGGSRAPGLPPEGGSHGREDLPPEGGSHGREDGAHARPIRELTYEPDDGRRYETLLDLDRVGAILGGRIAETNFGRCLTIDRRYEADRWHGDVQIGDCGPERYEALPLLDPALPVPFRDDGDTRAVTAPWRNPVYIDLETTGLSGGAGTVAFLVGCGYFDLGAFQVRQFLLTSYAAERALLAAVADFFQDADLIVTYNGKTFDVPVMETRWVFHRMRMPLEGTPHFDMLHPARRLWKGRTPDVHESGEGGCRLATLERTLLNMRRVGDVAGFEIPGRFFQFLRSGDPRPLEPVLEHNRLDLVSLAAVTGHALRLAREGDAACRDEAEALALGRVLERAGLGARADACYRRAAGSRSVEIRGEALYRLGLRCRRDRRYADAAAVWREVLALTEPRGGRSRPPLPELRRFAVEALAIHHEHRDRDLDAARELALFALDEDSDDRRLGGMRHRLSRLERKIAKKKNAQLFSS